MKQIVLSFFLLCQISLMLFAENYVLKINPSSVKQNQLQSQNGKIAKVLTKSISKSNASMNVNPVFAELDKYYTFNGSPKELEELKKSIEIEEIETNYIYRIETDCLPEPKDKLYTEQWALKAVNALKAWQYASGKSVKVAVIDTGIDYLNKQLKSNLWINYKEDINNNGTFEPWNSSETFEGVSGDLNGIDEDGNGYPDDVIGYDFVNQYIKNIGDAQGIDADPQDENGHGTSVSGVIAAKKDDEEIIGLAFDSQIMTLRAFDVSGNAESDDIAAAIIYAADNGAKVINMSFGEVFESGLIRSAIKYANSLGAVIVAAAGNNNWANPHFPSDFDEVISVSGIDENYSKFGSSNYGNFISISAPARNILTLDLGNKTKRIAGTSFATPYVAASAALLLELNPSLTHSQIRAMLESYSDDAGKPGWDSIFGAGRLNAGNALENLAVSNIEIKGISNDNFYNLSKENLTIEITATNPLLESQTLYLGMGENPKEWNTVFTSNENIYRRKVTFDKNTIIGNINLQDTLYTIRFEQKLKNLNSLERRLNFNLVNKDANEILYSNLIYSLFEDRYVQIFSAVTSFKSNFSIRVVNKQNQSYKTYEEYEKKSNFHTILVKDFIDLDKQDIYFIATVGKDSTILPLIIFQPGPSKNDVLPVLTKQEKNFNLPFVFLNNYVSEKLYDGASSIATNDFDNLGYGRTRAFAFDNNKKQFIAKDSSDNFYIPVGFGDSNKDGIEEVYQTGDYSNILTQANQKNGNPFSNLLYQSDGTTKAGGSRMFDLDNDGTPELLGRNDSAYYSIKFNGGYEQLNIAKMPKGIKGANSIDKASALGDFDGDGKNELAFMNEQGMLYIFEYNNGTYNLEFVDSNRYSNSSQYLVSGDINGDGKKDLITLTNTPVPFYSIVNGYDELWHLRVYKSTNENAYELTANNYIYGVRVGYINKVNQFYKNSLAVGNLTLPKGEEVVVSIFPNIYIFTDRGRNYLEPVHFEKNSFSSGLLVYDFDKNGKNELGFTSFTGTKFIEFDPDASPKPRIYKAYSLTDKKLRLELREPFGFYQHVEYRLYGDTVWQVRKKTNQFLSNLIDIDSLQTNKLYEVRVQYDYLTSKQDTLPSQYSDTLLMLPHFPYSVENIAVIDNKIFVKYNGALPSTYLENSIASVKLNGINLIIQNIITKGDSTAIISFIDNTPLISGQMNLKLISFEDKFSTLTLPFDTTFNYTSANNGSKFFVKTFEVLNDGTNRVMIKFSDLVSSESIDLNKIEISNNGRIESFSVLDSVLYLVLNSETIDYYKGSYRKITLNGVKSIDGVIIDNNSKSILIGSAPKDLSNVYIYPQPVKLSSCDKVMFGNISPKSKITILDIDGSYIQTLNEYDANGGTEWNLLKSNGERIKPGIYIFKVESEDSRISQSDLIKFAILP